MPDEFTPSEQRVWEHAWAHMFASEMKLMSSAEDSYAAELATEYANRAVAALRAYRTAHGAFVGARLAEGGRDG